MFELNLPKADIKLTSKNGKVFIRDIIRKKWLALSPEEYVRQHFLFYLIKELGYPASRISVERGLLVNKLARRSDIVVYDQEGLPFILVECKAPDVKITQAVLEQASGYNLTLKAKYLCVSNGLHHAFFKIDFMLMTYLQLSELPRYSTDVV